MDTDVSKWSKRTGKKPGLEYWYLAQTEPKPGEGDLWLKPFLVYGSLI